MMYLSSQTITLFAIFAPYTAAGGTITPQKVSTIIAVVNVIYGEMQHAVFGILQFGAGLVAFIRIQVRDPSVVVWSSKNTQP